MHPDYEYDKGLHLVAKDAATNFLASLERGDPSQEFLLGKIVAKAYIDLLERRGMPPDLKCYPSIQLRHGGWFDFAEPETTPVSPEDIASALSKLCRCTGHILGDQVYSVAQHCVYAHDQGETPLRRFKALMHDAPESVLGDVATPLKQMMPDYKRIEERVEAAFAMQFGLPIGFADEVKDIDIRMAATEKRDIMPEGEWEMLRGIDPYDFIIDPWSPARARTEWLDRFNEYQAYRVR